MIETHAHIYDEAFAEEIEKVVLEAKASGIQEIWMPNCDSSTIGPMLKMAENYPNFCLPMLGLHPCYVKENFEEELAKIKYQLDRTKVIAIGEIGIDLYWDKSYFKQQQEAFLEQCRWAIEANLWIDIHSREAFDETVALIEQINNPRLKGIFHCFSGNEAQAQKAIDLGFLLGIGGVVTFKNSGLDKALAHIAPEHLVLETDAPYLAPVPYRGKRNEPAYLKLVAQKLAEIYQTDLSTIIEITSSNAAALCQQFPGK